MEEVEERVSKLEAVLGRFIVQTDMMLKRMEQDTASFKEEMRRGQLERDEDLKEFREEVRVSQQARDKDLKEFREEIRADQQARDEDLKKFREDVRADQRARDENSQRFNEDIQKFREEVRADQQARDKSSERFSKDIQKFREEVRADQQARDKSSERFSKDIQKFREEVRADQQARDRDMREHREQVDADQRTLNLGVESIQKQIQEDLQDYKMTSNKRWGELANRLGTVVEDIVAPNLPTIAQQYFGCSDIDFFGLRIKRKNQVGEKDSTLEFDTILVCSDYLIVNETKTKPDASDVKSFREGQLKKIFDYFPEYQNKTVIPIFSSLSFTEATLKYLTKNKIYAMSSKGDTMDLLNFEAIQKKK